MATAALAPARAKAAGILVDDASRTIAARLLFDSQRSLRDSMLQGTGFADIVEPSYFLPGVAAGGYARDDMTDAMVRYLILRQTRVGSWRAMMECIPLDGSDVSLTAMAVWSLSLSAPPSRAAEVKARIARARDYLGSVDATTNEDLTMKALGLSWAGASAQEIAPTTAKLAIPAAA